MEPKSTENSNERFEVKKKKKEGRQRMLGSNNIKHPVCKKNCTFIDKDVTNGTRKIAQPTLSIKKYYIREFF